MHCEYLEFFIDLLQLVRFLHSFRQVETVKRFLARDVIYTIYNVRLSVTEVAGAL